jgi:hypothetical protein
MIGQFRASLIVATCPPPSSTFHPRVGVWVRSYPGANALLPIVIRDPRQLKPRVGTIAGVSIECGRYELA